jgi:hypothetical protein
MIGGTNAYHLPKPSIKSSVEGSVAALALLAVADQGSWKSGCSQTRWSR